MAITSLNGDKELNALNDVQVINEWKNHRITPTVQEGSVRLKRHDRTCLPGPRRPWQTYT